MTEYEQLSAAIESRIASDPQLRALRKKIAQGTATLAESSKYSQLCAQIMGQKLSGQVLGLSDREGVCTQLLRDRYSDVNQVCEQVMRSMDERAGIAMNPRHAAFPAERVQQLAHSLTDPTVPEETIQRRANTGAANVAISFHDDFVDENAAFRSDAGYECYITRVVGGASCSWCSAMAGRFRYDWEEMPEDIFRRHDNCTCTVTFEQGSFRQDVWSKRSWEAPKTGAGAPPPKVFSQEEADRLEQERLSEYRGLTSGGEGGIMNLNSDSELHKPITQDSIDSVPKLSLFNDEDMNVRHQQAAKDLLIEVKSHEGLPAGTEFSIRYDKDMKPIINEKYRQGVVGNVKISDYGAPFHALHNHGSDETLSFGDIFTLTRVDNMLSLTTVGNGGSLYSLVKKTGCDSKGFGDWLLEKSKESFFKVGDTDVNYLLMSNPDKWEAIKATLTQSQRNDLQSNLTAFCLECAEGGKQYGFEFKYQKT